MGALLLAARPGMTESRPFSMPSHHGDSAFDWESRGSHDHSAAYHIVQPTIDSRTNTMSGGAVIFAMKNHGDRCCQHDAAPHREGVDDEGAACSPPRVSRASAGG
jgi:hypothetical protein